jgi:hypothetical protein
MPHVSDGPSPGTSAETLASISVPDRLETVFGDGLLRRHALARRGRPRL